MIYNVNSGKINSDEILAGAVKAFLQDYKKELVRGGISETVQPVIFINEVGYSASAFDKPADFALLVQSIKSLGDGNFGSEEKIKRGAVGVDEATTTENLQKPKLPGQQ